MPALCLYGNCHNLGSRTYMGYCNQSHLTSSYERDELMEVLKKNAHLSTLRDARLYVSSLAKEISKKEKSKSSETGQANTPQ